MHLMGIRDRVGLAQQVRAPDRAHQQGTAAEQRDRFVRAGGVGDRVDDVLRRVPRRVERGESQPSDIEGGAVGQAAVLISELGPGTDHVGGTGQRREFAAARDVVVVEVRLDDADDPQVLRPRGLKVDIHVPAWVDHGGDARLVIGDKGRQVAETTDRELLDAHRRGA